MRHVSYVWDMSRMYESRLVCMSHVSYVWVTSLIYESRLLYMSHVSYIWVTLCMSHVSYVWVMYESRLLYMSHVAYIYKSPIDNWECLISYLMRDDGLTYIACGLRSARQQNGSLSQSPRRSNGSLATTRGAMSEIVYTTNLWINKYPRCVRDILMFSMLINLLPLSFESINTVTTSPAITGNTGIRVKGLEALSMFANPRSTDWYFRNRLLKYVCYLFATGILAAPIESHNTPEKKSDVCYKKIPPASIVGRVFT